MDEAVAVKEFYDYYPFGKIRRSQIADLPVRKYKFTGKELDDENGLDWYDFGARYYDAGIGRWVVADPMWKNHLNYTPYAYVLNNPFRYNDPDGMTEKERILAVETAKTLLEVQYGSSLPVDAIVKNGQLDCSGMVRYSIMKNETISDPFVRRNGNGVSRIMDASRKIDNINDLKDGNIVVLKSGDNENGHVGFVINIVKDANGNVTEYTILHSEAAWTNTTTGQSGGGSINEDKVVVGAEKGYAKSKYDHRFYAWDRPDKDQSLQEQKNLPVEKTVKNQY